MISMHQLPRQSGVAYYYLRRADDDEKLVKQNQFSVIYIII